MRSPLAAGHFKPQPRISIAALPGAAKLGHTTAQACTRALSRLAGISWRVALDRIEETSAPASDGFTSAHTFASSQSDVAALIILDRPAISALIEALMGGAGTEEPFDTGDRPLSRIEDGLLTLACRSIAEEVAQALTAQFDRAFSSAMATAAPQPGQDLVGASPASVLPSRSTSCSKVPWIRLEVPKSSTTQSVFTIPGCSSGSTMRSPRPTIWIMVDL